MSRRAVAPVVGVVLMLAVVVVLAGVVGAFVVGVGGQTEDAPSAVISADFNDKNNEVNITHQSGDELDVNNISVEIFVDGKPLKQQPDIPANGSDGFDGAFGGPFHPKSNDMWTAGETASLKIAPSNVPQPSVGSAITIKIYTDGKAVATAQV